MFTPRLTRTCLLLLQSGVVTAASAVLIREGFLRRRFPCCLMQARAFSSSPFLYEGVRDVHDKVGHQISDANLPVLAIPSSVVLPLPLFLPLAAGEQFADLAVHPVAWQGHL
jgi:hypothetical protein